MEALICFTFSSGFSFTRFLDSRYSGSLLLNVLPGLLIFGKFTLEFLVGSRQMRETLLKTYFGLLALDYFVLELF